MAKEWELGDFEAIYYGVEPPARMFSKATTGLDQQ